MKKSFTLIELIVVIAIIAILAAIIAPNAFKAIEKAKLSKMHADFKLIKTGFITLYADVGVFPLAEVAGPGSYGFSDDGSSEPRIDETDLLNSVLFTSGQGWDGPYIESAPEHPFAGVYRYDHDGDIYPDNGPYAGANVFCWFHQMQGMSNDKMAQITEKLDMAIDGGDGSTVGLFRYVPFNGIFYSIYTGQ